MKSIITFLVFTLATSNGGQPQARIVYPLEYDDAGGGTNESNKSAFTNTPHVYDSGAGDSFDSYVQAAQEVQQKRVANESLHDVSSFAFKYFHFITLMINNNIKIFFNFNLLN